MGFEEEGGLIVQFAGESGRVCRCCVWGRGAVERGEGINSSFLIDLVTSSLH